MMCEGVGFHINSVTWFIFMAARGILHKDCGDGMTGAVRARREIIAQSHSFSFCVGGRL